MTRSLALVALLLAGCVLVTSAKRQKRSGSSSGSSESPVPCCVALEAAVAALDTRTSDLETCVADVKADFGDRLSDLELFAIPCPPGYPLRFQDSCYNISAESLNWPDAKAACEEQGGKLAEIDTFDENEFLKQFARLDRTSGISGYWLGGNDRDTEGVYQWASDGRAITFFDWSLDPNGSFGPEPNNVGDEDCITIRVVSPHNSRWNDRDCHSHNRYICEISRVPE